MNEEIKAKWIEELSSGKYKKGNQFLRDQNDNFCALGVLADIIDPEGWTKGDKEWKWKGNYCTLPNNSIRHIDLPTNLQNKVGNFNDTVDSFEPVIDLVRTL